MFDKVNVSKIVRDHLGTFRDYSTGKPRPLDFFLFFVVPFIVAALFVGLYGVLPRGLIGIIVTSLSIFTALLLNLLLLAYNITQNSESNGDEHSSRMKEELFHEIFSNIAFAVLVALAIVVLVLSYGTTSDGDLSPAIHMLSYLLGSIPGKVLSNVISNILSFAIYYFGSLFLLTLLMLLKRVYILLSNERVASIS